jgi:hypothetical protein
MTHPATLLKNSWRAYARDFRTWLILISPIVGLGVITVAWIYFYPTTQGPVVIDASGSQVWTDIPLSAEILIAVVAFVLVARVFTTAIIISSYRSLNGQKPNIKESIKVGWRTFWPVIWVAILRDLIIIGGLILFIIPGIIWGLRYSLAVQAAVIEGKRGVSALHRSRELTNGKLFETFVNFGVIGTIIGCGAWIAIAAVTAVFIVLGTMITFIIPASANDAFATVVAIVTAIAEIITVWFIKPLSPLAINSVYKDYSDK